MSVCLTYLDIRRERRWQSQGERWKEIAFNRNSDEAPIVVTGCGARMYVFLSLSVVNLTQYSWHTEAHTDWQAEHRAVVSATRRKHNGRPRTSGLAVTICHTGSTRRASSSSSSFSSSSSSLLLSPWERERKRDTRLSSFRDARTRRDISDRNTTRASSRDNRTNACEARRFVTVCVRSRKLTFSVVLPRQMSPRPAPHDGREPTDCSAARRAASSTHDRMVGMSGGSRGDGKKWGKGRRCSVLFCVARHRETLLFVHRQEWDIHGAAIGCGRVPRLVLVSTSRRYRHCPPLGRRAKFKRTQEKSGKGYSWRLHNVIVSQ